MKVSYNKEGIPFIIADDDTIIDFSNGNANEIIGEISTNKEIIDEILAKTKQSIADKFNEYNNSPKNNFYELKESYQFINTLIKLPIIIDICESAEDLYFQLINPSPYKHWNWNRVLKKWEPPAPIPVGEIDEIYYWDEAVVGWVPVQPSPGENWVWSSIRHQWEPVVPYPLDAAPGEFVWDDDKETWVLANS